MGIIYKLSEIKSALLAKYREIYGEATSLSDIRDIHYARNDNQSSNIKYEDVILGGYKLLSDGQSALHRLNKGGDNGNDQNSKWTDFSGESEYVFKYQNGGFSLVKSPLNMGTFNFASPEDWDAHALLDILPWLLWGNTAEDAGNWTFKQRKKALINIETVFDLSTGWTADLDYSDLTYKEVIGNGGANTLEAANRSSKLKGKGGNDWLYSGKNADIIDGGSGMDTVSYKYATSGVTLNLLSAKGFDNYARGDTITNIENVEGSGFADIIVGDVKDNIIWALSGNDIVYGSRGNDNILGGAGNDELHGGRDDDTLKGGIGKDTLWGDEGGDTLWGQDGKDQLHGGLGNDILFGGGSRDIINGNEDNDALYGDAGNDLLFGGSGNDYLSGGLGKDLLNGGSGWDVAGYDSEHESGGTHGIVADMAAGTIIDTFGFTDTIRSIEWIIGSKFNDVFRGDDSDNFFTGLQGRDVFNGRDGFDKVDYAHSDQFGGSNGVKVYLNKGYAIDTFGHRDKLISIEAANGSVYADKLIGSAVTNWFYGHDGNDVIKGNGGNDGMAGGRGQDILWGGSGIDYFVFFHEDDSKMGNGDLIMDYQSGENLHFNFAPDGSQYSFDTFIGNAAFSGTAGELRAFISSGDTIVHGDANGDGVADFEFTLVGFTGLEASDFFFES